VLDISEAATMYNIGDASTRPTTTAATILMRFVKRVERVIA
jgi:hypothetical protein